METHQWDQTVSMPINTPSRAHNPPFLEQQPLRSLFPRPLHSHRHGPCSNNLHRALKLDPRPRTHHRPIDHLLHRALPILYHPIHHPNFRLPRRIPQNPHPRRIIRDPQLSRTSHALDPQQPLHRFLTTPTQHHRAQQQYCSFSPPLHRPPQPVRHLPGLLLPRPL